MTNREIIDTLYEISELLEVKGENKFKIRAYVKLAQFLSGYSKELEDIYKSQGKAGVLDVPNIGEGIGKKIIELIETGKLGYIEKLKSELPEGMETFLKIPGMGPKTAFIIGDRLKVKTVPQLEKALKTGRLSEIKGFGEKVEAKLLNGIELYKKGEQRKLLGEAIPVAEKIVSLLKEGHDIVSIEPAGSMRRMEDTVGDIDILAVAKNPAGIMKTFTTMDSVDYVIAKGEKKSSVYLKNRIQADLRVFDKKSYGAALQYFTGSKGHNVLLRELCVKKGLKLNEYGLFKGKKCVASQTEEDIYKALGLQYIPPELRQGTDEIETARAKKIPALVELSDLKGDLHAHSSYSDGHAKLGEMALAAKNRGYSYIAITDHSQSLKIAGGLDEKRLKEQWQEIDALNKKMKNFTILKGTEVDILDDGSLDYPDALLEKFDIVIGSVHTKFKLSKEEMTARLVKAIENPRLNIVGHISGRLINVREPYEIDYPRVFEAAAKNRKALEINCQPDRLDLRDIYVREALAAGVKLAISTDSHNVDSLDYIRYGIGKARRGRATKEDIINTMSVERLKGWLKK